MNRIELFYGVHFCKDYLLDLKGIDMKLKLLIALAALVPSLVMAQANLPSSASVGSTGKSGGGVPTPPIYTSPNTATGSSTTPSSSDLSTSGYRPTESVSSSASTGSSSGKSTSTTPANVGGKVDGHGSSNKATVKGSSQGSTYTNPCSSARTCN